MSFRVKGLPAKDFTGIFSLSRQELAARGGVRRIARHAAPCRISLTDATPGEEVVLINYEHHRVDSPYCSSYAIYVREGETTYDEIDAIPEQLRRRTLSVRGYDDTGMIVDAQLLEGDELEDLIAKLFADERIAYLHVHFARFGCYAAQIERI